MHQVSSDTVTQHTVKTCVRGGSCVNDDAVYLTLCNGSHPTTPVRLALTSLMWIWLGSPVDSMRELVLTMVDKQSGKTFQLQEGRATAR